MPLAQLKSLSQKADVSLGRTEHLYSKAKGIARKEYPDVPKDSKTFFEIVYGILKRMLGINEGMVPFADLQDAQDLNEAKDYDDGVEGDDTLKEICVRYELEPSDVKVEVLHGLNVELGELGEEADINELERKVLENMLADPLHYVDQVDTSLRESYVTSLFEADKKPQPGKKPTAPAVKPGAKPPPPADTKKAPVVKPTDAKEEPKKKMDTSNRVVGQLPIPGVTRKNPARINPKEMKPGAFYNYDYTSKMYQNGELAFYDAKPFILCIANEKPKILLGINLNYLPKNVKNATLVSLKSKFKNVFEKNLSFPAPLMEWNRVKEWIPVAKYIVKAYLKNRMKTPVSVPMGEAFELRATDTSSFFAISANEVHSKWKESAKMQKDKTRIAKVHGGPTEPGIYRV